MNDFKWRQFKGDIILGCVRWYCKYGISYRELEEIYGRNKQDKKTLDKITAVRALYPQRISEAEPRDASANYY